MSAPRQRHRIAIFSRYGLADQYDLAAEFKGMLGRLAAHNDVLHLSFKSVQPAHDVPAQVRVEEMGLTINRHAPRDILFKFILMYFYLPVIAWRLRRFKPDLIFLSEILPLVALLLGWLTGARVATAYGDWHLHNMLGRHAWSKPLLGLAEKLDRFEVVRLSGLFCRAATAGARAVAWGLPQERVRVVRDAPDPTAFFPRDASELRRQCGFQPDDVVFLYHGVMHAGKGIDKLMDWVNELYLEDNRIGLILVGGGAEQAALRERAAKLPIGKRTVFTGWLKTIREVGHYCCAADMCVAMRTAAEANARVVPGALLHSMACRKVVLAPRLSGVAEILRDGDNGFMFTPDDGADFKRLCRQLIERRAEWDAVAERAYQDALVNYSVEAAARQYAEALESFMGGHRIGPT
jgi:glycosyltransferase involved in cell wall biosynthesis